MITKKLVWFFGPSCAGKATSIEKIVNGDYGLYMQTLGLYPPCKAIKCEESLDKLKPRSELSSIILNKYNTLNTDGLLIKGQTEDLNISIPQDLRRQLTKLEHKIVFLWAEPKELNRRRLETRSGYPWDSWSIDTHIDELKIQVEKVSKLAEENFPVIWIDNTDNQPKELDYGDVKLRVGQLNQTN